MLYPKIEQIVSLTKGIYKKGKIGSDNYRRYECFNDQIATRQDEIEESWRLNRKQLILEEKYVDIHRNYDNNPVPPFDGNPMWYLPENNDEQFNNLNTEEQQE